MQDEKEMRERLEDASLKELLPDFDHEATWAALQQKMLQQPKPQQKKRIILGWYSHAAAVLIGILLTWAFFSQRQPKQEVQIAAVYTKLPPAVPKIDKSQESEWRKLKRSNDSLKSLLTMQLPQSAPRGPQPSQVIVAVQRPATVQQPQPVPPMQEHIEQAPATTSGTTIAVAPELKVIHYMDVENEDQGIMVKPAPTVFDSKIRFRVNRPNGTSYRPEQSVLPLRELFTVSQ